MKYSKPISDFLDFIKDAEKKYNSAQDELDFLAKERTDIDHEIEFAANKREAQRSAWKFHQNQVDRRYNKDLMLMLEPLVRLIESDRKTFERLRNVLGEVRKKEDFTGSDRKYYSRVEAYYGRKEAK